MKIQCLGLVDQDIEFGYEIHISMLFSSNFGGIILALFNIKPP